MSIFADNEQGTLEVYPVYMCQLTGVASVFHVGRKFRLTYLDGSSEEATIPAEVIVDLDNLFSVTGMVQAYARRK